VPAPMRATRRAGGWQAALLLAGSCMPVMGSVLITPILPQLSQKFGDQPGGEILVPMIVAIPALMIAIFAPFAGQIVDRLGRKTLLIITMFAYALVGTAPAWLESLPLILFSRVLVGVCEAAIMTVCTTLIVDYFHDERRRNRYLGLQVVATTLAATVFIALGGALGVSGWHTPFWIYALSIVIAVPMIFSLWEPSKQDATDSHVQASGKVRTPWRRIWVPVIVSIFGGFSFYIIALEVGYLVVGTGVAATNSGVIGAVAAAASLAAAIGGISFMRIGKLPTGIQLPIAFGLQAIGMVIIWFVPGTAGIVVGAVIAGLGGGLLLPSLLTWLVSRTGFEERGRVTGWFTSAFFFGQFLTPILAAALTQIARTLPAAIGVVGVLAAVVAIATGVALRARSPR